MTSTPAITINNVSKSVFIGDDRMAVLKHITCSFRYGDYVIVYGPAGSGKSIFLYTLLGIEEPTSGSIVIEGANVSDMNDYERANFRRSRIGIVYGHPLWVGSLSVAKNIEFSLQLNGHSGSAEAKALEILDMVNMRQWANHHPTDLDNLQQQQIAIARAMVTNPDIIVADDPTRHLDLLSGHKLMQTFKRLNAYNKTVIVVTSTPSFLQYATRPLRMDKGNILEEALHTSSTAARVS